MSFEALTESVTPEVYSQIEALSYSGMKALAVSPLRYWHLFVNPNRPAIEETPAQRFGTALHCAVLEPGQFDKRYCRELRKEDVEGCLDTMDDLREYAASKGLVIKERKKDAYIARILDHDPNAPVFDIIYAQWSDSNTGKVALKQDEWERVHKAADALRSEPVIRTILSQGGEFEKCYVRIDPFIPGVVLKGRLDFVSGNITLDLKTFSATRGKSIDRCVNEAILYEKYHWQAFHYTHLRKLSGEPNVRHIIPFVESEEPFEVRIRELKPRHGETNLYWEQARTQIRDLIEQYAHYSRKFGKSPWRDSEDVEVLTDENLPSLAYS
jgi:hypothetical protein